ncbi:unnamed protein product [Blepharisma stoltei]|uniref:Receptor ligand binding region domain-containing protein n=1 Tax=Blepharisma stoltei TaxID=1481888 RepID=A0AAU9J1G3_9CILI|nr:unnamed protein product [Blepharisma stoltei]
MLALFCYSFRNFPILFALFQLSTALEVIVTYQEFRSSYEWSQESVSEISHLHETVIDWHLCNVSRISLCIDEFPDSLIILDLSTDLDTQYYVAQICKNNFLIHLALQEKFVYKNDWTFSVLPSKSKQIEAFLAVLSYFEWKEGILFLNKENYEEKKEILEFSSKFNILDSEESTSYYELVHKLAFRLGATLYYIFTDSKESLEIQNLLKNMKLLTVGNGIILNQKSGYDCIIDGALIITDFGQELVTSSIKYYKNSISNIFSYILNLPLEETAQDTISVLKLNLKNYHQNANFSLVNIQNRERVIVGSIINNSITLSKDLIFPGSSKSNPKSTKKILNLSINAGPTNPNAAPVTTGVIGSRGAFVIKDKINEGSSELLSNFQLEFFNYNCGATIFNYTFSYSCFQKDMDKFGVAHVSSHGSPVAIGALQIFKQLNLTFPVIGTTNSDFILNSTAKYPMFTRVGFSTSYVSILTAVLLRAMGWKKAALLSHNDSWGSQRIYYLSMGARLTHLEIINPENTWTIPPNLDREGLKNYTHIIQGIINSQARLLIYSIQYPMSNYVLEMFYDLGLRKGDLVMFSVLPDTLISIGNNDTYRHKRVEIGIPMIDLQLQNWVGEVGRDVKNRIISTYKEPPNGYSCNYADGAYLIAYALDYMINRGQDYNDPFKLEATIRNQQFYGCTGRVSIEKGSNDRATDALDIGVNKLNPDGTLSIQLIGSYKPYSTQVLKYTTPMIYAGGTTIKPNDLRDENSKCPFSTRLVKTFVKGRELLFGICFGIVLITIVITVFIWKTWWNIPIEMLNKKEEISMQDMVVGITIAVEFFQYAAMGPDFSLISSTLSKVSDAFSLNLDDLLELKNGVFWIVVNIVFGGIGLWIVLCLVVLLRLDEKQFCPTIFQNLSILADYLMPILGNLCFIPFVSICLDIFICDQSIGNNFTDSFLSKDCYYFCWKDEHLVYSIISFIALILYEPLAVFCRPLWQELQPMLHVKAVPLFLMVKTIVQVILIVINKTVKRSEEIAHGILFIAVMIFYILFIFKFKPYNYQRFSWWQGLSLIGVCWLAILSTIGLIANEGYIPLLTILIIGWLIIAIIGLYVQKKRYPSLLFRKKGKDTSTLFKFAFTLGKHSKLNLTKISPNEGKKLSY